MSFQVYKGYDLSASEVLWLLNTYVSRVIRKALSQFIELDGTPLAPSNGDTNARMAGPVKVPWYQFRRAVKDVEGALHANKQVPTVVWIGGKPYPPASYLVALAHVADGLLQGHQAPKDVTLASAHLETTKYVARNTHDTWDWPILRPGFNRKYLLDLAKLQTWTVKPAQLETAQRPAATATLRSR